MKTALAVIFMLAAAYTGLAQSNAIKSPPGEPPFNVRNGRAKLVGHFNDPRQMLRLAFGLVPPHLAEEEEFLQELMTPGSPQFHQFLTPEQWDARFAPTVEDEQAVVDWATSQGLTITHRYPDRLLVDVEAPVATIEKALQVTINNYLLEGYTYFANEREPVIPAHLSGIIRSVGGLHNFPQMRPEHFSGKQPPGPLYNPGPVVGVGHTYHADGDGTKRQQAPANSSQGGLLPNFTNGYKDPTDIYNSGAYDYNALQNLGHCCNPLSNAGGSPPQSSIALATYGNFYSANIVGFQAQYPYLAYNITPITIDGGPPTCTVGPKQPCDNDLETALDTEWSTATANSFGSYLSTAQVYVYEDGGSAEDMYNQMYTDGHAKIFSTSWSCTEISGCSASEMDTDHGIFNNMLGTGWTLMTASGDRGATDDCAHVSVSYPASDPDVIGVGGTELQQYSDSSFDFEVAWTGGTGSGSCSHNNGGSGGGCSVHFATPGFQSGSNGSCGTHRSVPDIALNAYYGQNMYFNGSLFPIGGTSISSPMLAGFFAQEGAYLLYLGSVTGNSCGSFHRSCTPMGNGNTYLYYFGLHPSYAPHYPFYDTISGCNSNDITAANHFTAFCAGVGYDSVTGWGSANMLQLAWAINTYIGGDFGPPAVNFSGPTISHWYNTDHTVSWSISDTSAIGAVANGVAGFSQAWDSDPGDVSSEPTPGTGNSFYSGPQFPNATSGYLYLSWAGQGCHTAHVRAWDNGGTTSDNTYGPVCLDTIPPTISLGLSSPPNAAGWFNNTVTVTLSASDPGAGSTGSGVAARYYGVDAPGCLTRTLAGCTVYSSPFNITTEGRHAVQFFTQDVAGNFSGAQPGVPVNIDKTPPHTRALLTGNVRVGLIATDNLSGVASTVYQLDGGTVTTYTLPFIVSAKGAHTVTFHSTDQAGNVEATETVNFTVH